MWGGKAAKKNIYTSPNEYVYMCDVCVCGVCIMYIWL